MAHHRERWRRSPASRLRRASGGAREAFLRHRHTAGSGVLPKQTDPSAARVGNVNGSVLRSRKTDGPAVRGGQFRTRTGVASGYFLRPIRAIAATNVDEPGGATPWARNSISGVAARRRFAGIQRLAVRDSGQRGAMYSSPGAELFFRRTRRFH